MYVRLDFNSLSMISAIEKYGLCVQRIFCRLPPVKVPAAETSVPITIYSLIVHQFQSAMQHGCSLITLFINRNNKANGEWSRFNAEIRPHEDIYIYIIDKPNAHLRPDHIFSITSQMNRCFAIIIYVPTEKKNIIILYIALEIYRNALCSW